MKNILIIAGEASGDVHGAELVKRCLERNPNLTFCGIGGENMRKAGVNLLFDNKEISVIGIFEILTHFKIIRKAFNTIKNYIKKQNPDLVIFIDYPAFNLRMAKIAHKYHRKVLYFISPQLWAWKKGRIKQMQEYVDKIAVIFPFEVDFYRQNNVDAIYVGNPLAEQVHSTITKDDAYEKFQLDKNHPVIALLPGSRRSELKFMFDTILQTAVKIKQHKPNAQFVIPVSTQFDTTDLEEKIAEKNLEIKLIPNQLYNILQITNAALCVSGTVTLEVALMGTPFAIFYKLNNLTYAIGKILVKIDMIGLCNIVAKKKVAQEFIQHDATPENLSAEMLKLIDNEDYRSQQLNAFKNLKQEFYSYPSKDISEVVEELL